MENTLLVGYARGDMTPKEPVPLAGYGNTLTRIHQGVLDPLMATCVAISDRQNGTILLFALDIVATREKVFLQARQQISQQYGIPVEAVILSATHTHSGPDFAQKDHPGILRYGQQLAALLTEVAGKALTDRQSAVMYCGKTYNSGMNYVRHYIQENGAICGDNYGDHAASPYKCHVSEADRELRLVRFRRETGKDVLIANWQAHPNLASTIATEYGRAHRPLVSADYVGSCRDYVEEHEDVHFAFFQGAAGNLNSRSRLEWEVDTRDHRLYGQQLGAIILEGLGKMQPLTGGKVAAVTKTLHGRANHSEDYLEEEARKIRVVWQEKNDAQLCMQLGKPYGIHSAYHAGAILGKLELPSHLDMTLGAARIGQLGVAALPYEVFDTNGKYIREKSPYPMTLILSSANGGFNYIPSAQGFAHGCYEADMCKHAPGTGEEAADLAVQMLAQLHTEE